MGTVMAGAKERGCGRPVGPEWRVITVALGPAPQHLQQGIEIRTKQRLGPTYIQARE